MNKADVQRKLEIVPENIERLEDLRAKGEEAFAADFRNIDSALHRLQTTIQALIDIGSYIIAELGLRTPSTFAEVIEILCEAGCIEDQERDAYISMVQFRNRVVHLYNKIDVGLVYNILEEGLDDFRQLYKTLLETIEAHEQRRE